MAAAVVTKAPIKAAMFSAREYDISSFDKYLAQRPAGSQEIQIQYLKDSLSLETAKLAEGCSIVIPFVNDNCSASTLEALKAVGVRAIAMRCAGYNNVDVAAAARLELPILRVPAYSPNAVAEMAVTLMMTLNRNIKKAIDRGRHCNFDLSGLAGRDIAGSTVGVVGTGKIGMIFARILHGFGAKLLGFDVYHNPDAAALGMTYVTLDELLKQSDIISLHCNLTPENKHMFNAAAFEKMKRGSMLINTSRGALVNTKDAIAALKTGQLGHLGVDVVEEEGPAFFRYSERDFPDELSRLLLFSNVIVTGHQSFLTEEALAGIATTTLANIDAVEAASKEHPLAGPSLVTA